MLRFMKNNATGEAQGPFADTSAYYFDSLYCSWDTVSTPSNNQRRQCTDAASVPNFLPAYGSSLSRRICSNRRRLHRRMAQDWLDARVEDEQRTGIHSRRLVHCLHNRDIY